jgi:hypothetical protein
LIFHRPTWHCLERGLRPVTWQLERKIATLYRLGPTALPVEADVDSCNSASLATSLAGLGYPGFRHLRGGKKNPSVILLAAITANDVEVRVIEGLPWLIVEYNELNWEWLIREAKLRDVQNRLGSSLQWHVRLPKNVPRTRVPVGFENRGDVGTRSPGSRGHALPGVRFNGRAQASGIAFRRSPSLESAHRPGFSEITLCRVSIRPSRGTHFFTKSIRLSLIPSCVHCIGGFAMAML